MRRRQGFTIVEMLVAMALVMFIMVILSEAFVAGLESFRTLKAIGDMNEKLRSATTDIRANLRAYHFDTGLTLKAQTTSPAVPPVGGFFRIWQGSQGTSEGTDPLGIPSIRATDHMLHFTVRRTGGQRENFMSALVPAGSPLAHKGPAAFQDAVNDNVYNSQWAEVAYFLRPAVTAAGGPAVTAEGTQLYALYRRQLLAGPYTDVNTAPNQRPSTELPAWYEVSCEQDPANGAVIYFNTPNDLTEPVRRFGMAQGLAGGQSATGMLSAQPDGSTSYPIYRDNAALTGVWGADLLLADVVSFEVKFMVVGGADFIDLWDASLLPSQNPAFGGPGQPRVFDTWSTNTDAGYGFTYTTTGAGYTVRPVDINISALKITLRVWDQRTQRTRQITVVQDM